MGIISRAKRIWAAAWGADDDRWYYPGGSFFGAVAPTDSGVPIDSESALRLMTVHNCVKVLSQSIAQLPLHLMRQSDGVKTKATDHYLYPLLHDQPNSWMTATEFWGMAIAHISLRGNFYAYKMGVEGRPIQQLIPLAPDIVQKVTQDDKFKITYTIRLSDGTTKDLKQDKIMHLRGLTINGFEGVNPIEYARETVGVGLSSTEFLDNFFKKGMRPCAILKHPLSLSVPAHKNLREKFKQKYAGLGNSWEMMLIDEGMDITFPDIKLVDAQFLELAKFNEAQICGLFRVPLMLVQGGDKSPTYASAEQFMLAFVTHALTPLVVNIEQAIKRDLISSADKKEHYAKFSMGGLLRGDMKSRFEAYGIGIDKEIYCPNEVRDMEDMNPYEGGDEYRTRTSSIKEPKE